MNLIVPTNGNSCPKCHNQNIEEVEYSDTVDFRGMELDVEQLQETKCGNCEHRWTTSTQHTHNTTVLRATYGIKRDMIRESEGFLAGREIAAIRENFALNQREAALLFGGGFNAFNKYESGEVLQSFAMDRLLRLTKVVGKPAVEFLRNVFSTPNFNVISTTINDQPSRFTIDELPKVSYIANTISGTTKHLKVFESMHPTDTSLP